MWTNLCDKVCFDFLNSFKTDGQCAFATFVIALSKQNLLNSKDLSLICLPQNILNLFWCQQEVILILNLDSQVQ